MGSRTRAVRWVTVAVCASLVAGACSGGGSKANPPAPKPVVPPRCSGRTTGPFAVTLTAGHPAAAATQPVSVVTGDKLDRRAIATVVDRLPPFETGGGAAPFKRPPESLPRPRVGATITKPFGGTAPDAEAGADRQRSAASAALPTHR